MSTLNESSNTKGSRSKLTKINSVLGVGMVGVDSAMRMRDGESAPAAIGGALVTNALWSLVPGGLVGGLAVMGGMAAIELAPAVQRKMEEKTSALNASRSRFGSNFQSTEAQQMLQSQGLNQISSAQNHLASRMSNHARNAQRVY